MKSLAAIETAFDERHDVLDALGRILREQTNLNRALDCLQHEDRIGGRGRLGLTRAGRRDEHHREKRQRNQTLPHCELLGLRRTAYGVRGTVVLTPTLAHSLLTTHAWQRGYTGLQTFWPQV